MIKQDLNEDGVTDMTAQYGDRLVEARTMFVLASDCCPCRQLPVRAVASKEYMFPFVSVVECPQDKMIKEAGYTLVGTAITNDRSWIDQLTDATNIDRLEHRARYRPIA